MTRNGKHAEQRDRFKGLKWTFLVSSAVIAVVVDHFMPGWGRPVVLTLLIFGALVGFGRPYWCTPFWTVVVGTFALHVTVVTKFRAMINELTLPGLFLWAVAEIVAIAVILGFVFPDKKESPLHH